MPSTAMVNYHVHKPEQQAFHIDADGIVGKIIWPELSETEITLLDTRKGETHVSFADDGLTFATWPTDVADFTEEQSLWTERYHQELTALLREQIGVREVEIFDHTVRTDDPQSKRPPARNVHSDYSETGAQQRLIDILGAERAAEWAAGHYAFINVWRPVGHPINSAPLGFVRPSSVAQEDWILLDLIYPDRKGQILGLVANPAHEWIFCSSMRPDEVACFNIYDNRQQSPVAHSAMDRIEDQTITTIRQSLESRTLVRY